MSHRLALGAVAVFVGLTAAACSSGSEQKATESSTAASTESHEGHTAAKVYFVEPKDGATVPQLTKFVFGTDNYEISAVPADAKEARPNVGHFHLGVDTDCLPAGTVIPKAEEGPAPGTAGSWIHFGNGTNMIEMSMAPGPHKFAVEVGDDLHRAVEGLCQTINVTVK